MLIGEGTKDLIYIWKFEGFINHSSNPTPNAPQESSNILHSRKACATVSSSLQNKHVDEFSQIQGI